MKNLLNNILSATDPITIRLLMKDAGWKSKDVLTDIGWGGEYGYSIWFERWDWHGVQIFNKVCFHNHSSKLDNITETVRVAAKLALNAWIEYPDSVPNQLANGILGVDFIITKTFKEEKIKLRKEKLENLK